MRCSFPIHEVVARRLGTEPPVLVPDQAGGPPEAGEIHQLDHRSFLHLGEHSAPCASRSLRASFNVHSKRITDHVVDAEDVHWLYALRRG
jgi:hypothetical protein